MIDHNADDEELEFEEEDRPVSMDGPDCDKCGSRLTWDDASLHFFCWDCETENG